MFFSKVLNGIRHHRDGLKSIHQILRQFSVYPSDSFAIFDGITAPRTAVSNPALHNENHLGLWYTIDPEISKRIYGSYEHTLESTSTHPMQLPKKFMELCHALDETAIMVRQPSLDVIDYIKKSDLSMPPNKFMYYGENGSGKSLCLAHVLHYLALDGWIIIHLGWPAYWRNRFQMYKSLVQLVESTAFPGLIDQPIKATVWLRQFLLQNNQLLKQLQLKTHDTYEWSKREILHSGSPLTDIIEQGIGRSRMSSHCVYALVSELKKHATAGNCKIALVADGINSLFREGCKIKLNHQYVNAQNFVLHEAFKQLLKSDWKNGTIVGTVCKFGNDEDMRESALPRYLLGAKGWETLDPFVPIHVESYNETELTSAIDYYVEQGWIQHPMINTPMGRKEVNTVTGRNPWALMEFIDRL